MKYKLIYIKYSLALKKIKKLVLDRLPNVTLVS